VLIGSVYKIEILEKRTRTTTTIDTITFFFSYCGTSFMNFLKNFTRKKWIFCILLCELYKVLQFIFKSFTKNFNNV